jgi:predicted kinase
VTGQHVVLVTGWPGAGKSTIADAVAADLGATVASFDWLLSALRAFPDLWAGVELPVERQRAIGWSLMERVAEQALRRGQSVVLDHVAREEPRRRWQELAERAGAAFAVIECVCSDADVHRRRVEGRTRAIPGWYELDWDHVEQARAGYVPMAEPKLVLDAIAPLADNVAAAHPHDARQRGGAG